MAINWGTVGQDAASGATAGAVLGPWGAGAGALVGGIAGALSGDPNANAQKALAAQQAYQKQTQGLITNAYGQAQQAQQPLYNMGMANLGTLNANVNSGAYQMPAYQQAAYQGPDPANFNYQQSPGYQFEQQQGHQALQNAGAAAGTPLSGASLKSIGKFDTGLASQDYTQQLNNYLSQAQLAGNQYAQQSQLGQSAYNMDANQLQNQYARQAGLADMASLGAQNMGNLALGESQALGANNTGMGNIAAQQAYYQPSQYGNMQNALQGAAGLVGVGSQQWPGVNPYQQPMGTPGSVQGQQGSTLGSTWWNYGGAQPLNQMMAVGDGYSNLPSYLTNGASQ